MTVSVRWRVCIVTGGRNFRDQQTLFAALDRLDISLVIEGGASGADLLARQWAEKRGVQHLTDWALWTAYGKSAGPLRNGHMLSVGLRLAFPDEDGGLIVAAFPGGRGTENMVSAAVRAGVPVHRFGVDVPVSPVSG